MDEWPENRENAVAEKKDDIELKESLIWAQRGSKLEQLSSLYLEAAAENNQAWASGLGSTAGRASGDYMELNGSLKTAAAASGQR